MLPALAVGGTGVSLLGASVDTGRWPWVAAQADTCSSLAGVATIGGKKEDDLCYQLGLAAVSRLDGDTKVRCCFELQTGPSHGSVQELVSGRPWLASLEVGWPCSGCHSQGSGVTQ